MPNTYLPIEKLLYATWQEISDISSQKYSLLLAGHQLEISYQFN